ncbi:MAG: right-handed parallel beta-helix repeat-containing protein [Dehalococcoidia bacterium]
MRRSLSLVSLALALGLFLLSRLSVGLPAADVSAQTSSSPTPAVTGFTASCSTIPQTFTITTSGSGFPLPVGATLSTNAPNNPAVPSLNLSGLQVPNTFFAGPGGTPSLTILPQPFVALNAPNAFVTLNIPGTFNNTISCPTNSPPAQLRSLFVSNLPGIGLDIVDCTNAAQASASSSFCNTFCPVNSLLCANTCTLTTLPCATIPSAVSRARAGDTITVQSSFLPYRVEQPIEVPILLTIRTDGNVVVLQSVLGLPIFHVTSSGSPSLHTMIGGTGSGFFLGGTASTNQPGAIVLEGDGYTEVAGNTIGSQDLPNGIGVLLHNSDHPNIHDNIIHGSTVFAAVPSLQVGAVDTGFGIVTAECLGQPEPSDSVTIVNNSLVSNSNAGIWLCSDSSGGHAINANTVRNNGRGIVLFDVVDSTLNSNVVENNLGDGIQVVGASATDTLSANTIESQAGRDSAGIRLWGNGGLVFPLNITLTGNTLRRNTTGIVIAGARTTTLTNNTVEATAFRTGILLTVGSDLAGGRTTQPVGTTLTGNTLIYNGICTAQAGCAIRLAPGVVADVSALQNQFGFASTSLSDIRAVIFDKNQDPGLGQVVITGTPPVAGAASGPAPTSSPAASPFPTSTPR